MVDAEDLGCRVRRRIGKANVATMANSLCGVLLPSNRVRQSSLPMTARRGTTIWAVLLVIMPATQKTTAILRISKPPSNAETCVSQCKLFGLAAAARCRLLSGRRSRRSKHCIRCSAINGGWQRRVRFGAIFLELRRRGNAIKTERGSISRRMIASYVNNFYSGW